MKLSDLKWWHWTLATILIAAGIRLATGGPLPFIGRPGAPKTTAIVESTGRPAREPNLGPNMHDVVTAPGLTVELATPEVDRLTIEGSVANPGTAVGLVDQTGALVREIARALQKGVREDSTAITQVRILVATKGVDRTGKEQAHLPLYSLTYKASDLYAMKSTTTPGQALAPAMSPVFNGADAHQAMRDWCAKPENLNEALGLCALVTAAKGV